MNPISYASSTSDVPLLGLTIGQALYQTAQRFPQRDALIVRHQNIRWSYQEFYGQVESCARALLALQIQRGDRVGIWSPNRSEWTVLQFATAKIGAVLVNINPSYRLHELQYALNHSGVKLLVSADAFKKSDYTAMLYELFPELLECKPGALESSQVPTLTTIIRLDEQHKPGMMNWNAFLEKAEFASMEKLQEREATLHFDDPINIQYTSGTTGYPKGATLSHHNILNNAFFVSQTMRLNEKDKVIIPVPLYHCFGMVLGNLGCVVQGATMVYPSEGFETKPILQMAQQERATALYGVPTMFIALLEDEDFSKYDLSSLRTGIMAGAPCPIEVMKKVQTLMHMKEVQIAYGLTEVSPVCTQTRFGTSLEKQVSTVGQIHPHLEIKLIDPETGAVVPTGMPGELCIRGYSVMLGYWNDEKRTRDTIDQARWLHSGDLATMDEMGYFKIVGRIKEMIIRGGENIYPREIEEFFYTNPKVCNVQVIGVPDAKYGEEVMAWIQLHDGETATEEEMKSFCKGQIAHFKIPKYFKFTSSFPMTVTGKVRKIEMREISIRELGLEAAASMEMA